jgi:hypothetical protein
MIPFIFLNFAIWFVIFLIGILYVFVLLPSYVLGSLKLDLKF